MARKSKKKQTDYSSTKIFYGGEVRVESIKNKKKHFQTKAHNEGTLLLMSLLISALDNYGASSTSVKIQGRCPYYIMGFDSDDKMVFNVPIPRLSSSTRYKNGVVVTGSKLGDAIEFQFLVSQLNIIDISRTIVKFELYDSTVPSVFNNSTDRTDFKLATVNLDTPLSIEAGANFMVYWKMTFSNKTE